MPGSLPSFPDGLWRRAVSARTLAVWRMLQRGFVVATLNGVVVRGTNLCVTLPDDRT